MQKRKCVVINLNNKKLNIKKSNIIKRFNDNEMWYILLLIIFDDKLNVIVILIYDINYFNK